VRLRLIDPPRFAMDGSTFKPGDCWYARAGDGGVYYWWADSDRLVKPAGGDYADIAPEHAGCRPMLVALPNGGVHCLQTPAYRDGKPGPRGWTVTGNLPNVTVSPSINYGTPGTPWHWHGFITSGEMA
jgi:hypothetical protein